MKNLVMLACLVAATGCTSVRTHQVEVRYDEETGVKTAEITTKASGTTFFEGEQALAGLKAEQTEGTQGFELTGLNQQTSSTNAVNVLNAVAGVLNAARP